MMGCKNLCSLSPFGAEGPPLLKPFVQNPLFKTPCFQQRIVSLLFNKREREKKKNQYKMKT